MKNKSVFDVIVVGGGHAGCEAALASARLGVRTLLITMHIDTIGAMSCNPAIGGLAKGQLVKEIDALGGEMGRAIDRAGIQFRQLNTSKGPAVRSSRAQADRTTYKRYMQGALREEENLFLWQDCVSKIVVDNNEAIGVKTSNGKSFFSRTTVLTPGTFLNGLIHIGLEHFAGGRIGEAASTDLAGSIKDLGFSMKRFKTGTCPRLDGRTIDFSRLKPQRGDDEPTPFSFSTKTISQRQVPCYITYTNQETHRIIRSGLDRSPLFTGVIKGTGVRYCPSIEDKLVKFADKDRHQIFLEPEGLDTYEIYPNGLATSLPLDVQESMIHSIEGLEHACIVRPGYGIEHDIVDSVQLKPTLETKLVRNLYFAGQINGTTGYEEAAAQGLLAGVNAARRTKEQEPLVLDRSQAVLGVLIDDLVTKGTNEPYRMFTSRCEHRLVLREDNADLRLRSAGFSMGLVSESECAKTIEIEEAIKQEIKRLQETFVNPTSAVNNLLKEIGEPPLDKPASLEAILRRPLVHYGYLRELSKQSAEVSHRVAKQVEIHVKYQGYIERQEREVTRFSSLERLKIPADFNFDEVQNLSREIREKLTRFQPTSIGQASRISGVTPAALGVLSVYLERRRREQERVKAT